jgi:hypothetical protein
VGVKQAGRYLPVPSGTVNGMGEIELDRDGGGKLGGREGRIRRGID